MNLLKLLFGFAVAVIATVPGTFAGAADVALDPRAAFLHVCQDGALDAPAIALAGLGVSPGETLVLELLGDFDNGPGEDMFVTTIAVFSSSAVLLPGSALHRVPGAIAAGTPTVTGSPYFCSDPTDIPEDFRVASVIPNTSVVVQVPSGATHLFVCPADNLFGDNSDPDHDYAIRITKMILATEVTTWGAVKSLYRFE